MDFLCGGNDFVEVPNDGIAFRLRDADDARDKARIKEQRFPPGDRVGANQGVLCDDWITTDRTTSSTGSVGLHVGRVERAQPL